MRSILPFVLETSTLFFIAFVVITNVLLPLLFDVPLWWMVSRRGRRIVDERFREFLVKLKQKRNQTE